MTEHAPIIGVRSNDASVDYGEAYIIEWDAITDDYMYAEEVLEEIPEDHPYREQVVEFIEMVWPEDDDDE